MLALAHEYGLALVGAGHPGAGALLAHGYQKLGLVAIRDEIGNGPDLAAWRINAHGDGISLAHPPKARPKNQLWHLAREGLPLFPADKHRVDIGRRGTEPDIQAASGRIDQVGQGALAPKRLFLRRLAAAFHGISGKGTHRLALDPDFEMEMGKFRFSGKADQPQGLARGDPIPDLDPDAALSHMAILRLHAVGMGNEHAIAAFAVLDGGRIALPDAHVRHTVANAAHHARSRRLNPDSFLHHGIRNSKIDSLVLVIGKWPTVIIGIIRTGGGIDVVLNKAIDPGHAVNWLFQ